MMAMAECKTRPTGYNLEKIVINQLFPTLGALIIVSKSSFLIKFKFSCCSLVLSKLSLAEIACKRVITVISIEARKIPMCTNIIGSRSSSGLNVSTYRSAKEISQEFFETRFLP